VARLARELALAAGLTRGAAETVAQAGLLHDLGKIGVPEAILNKPGALTPEEWQVMRRHPVISAQIVAPLDFFDQGALILRHHHERFDGSGYPDGLCGAAIPVGARIVAITDIYDALTSERSYRRRLPHADAVRYLRSEAGQTLDEHLVEVFLDRFGGVGIARPRHADAAAERAV
jgi:putative two-component system response regulator